MYRWSKIHRKDGGNEKKDKIWAIKLELFKTIYSQIEKKVWNKKYEQNYKEISVKNESLSGKNINWNYPNEAQKKKKDNDMRQYQIN